MADWHHKFSSYPGTLEIIDGDLYRQDQSAEAFTGDVINSDKNNTEYKHLRTNFAIAHPT